VFLLKNLDIVDPMNFKFNALSGEVDVVSLTIYKDTCQPVFSGTVEVV